MAHSANLSARALDEVAQQVGALLGDIAEPALLNAQPIELKETFEVWMLSLDVLAHGASTNKNLAQLARPVGRWHHQITFAGNAAAFARSSLSPEDGRQTLEELFMSPLASKIDQAVDWIDQNISGDPLVTLLIVAAYYLHALWLADTTRQSSQVLVVEVAGPSGTLQNLQSGQLLDDQTFLRTLVSAPASIGVLLGGVDANSPMSVSVP